MTITFYQVLLVLHLKDSGDLQQVISSTLAHDLAGDSVAFISTPRAPSKIHVIITMGTDYGSKSRTESSETACFII